MEIIRQHFTTIDSTNSWAKLHAHELQRDKITLVTADTQTAGRGRFKRKWESPPGRNIYASFCFFVEGYSPHIGNIPQVLALSTAKILKTMDFDPSLKWPNDILLSEKKVAGILAETTALDQLCVVIGIGLNVNMPKALLQKIDRPATSLMVESGRTYDPEEILAKLAQTFSADLDRFFSRGFTPFIEPYRQSMSRNPDRTIRFNDNKNIWEGKLHAINEEGSISLKLFNGEIKTFIAGEILWPGE